MTGWRSALLVAAVVLLAAQPAKAGGLDPLKAGKHMDELLAKELAGQSQADMAPVADDQTFLRRVSLDLIGNPPSPEEVTAFSLDNSPDKRNKVVARLLANPKFGDNWGHYWRDVILYRRSEDRALIAAPAAVKFLSNAFNNDPHWDKIARNIITATGDVRENGATALIMGQMANAEDTTAEISRVFLGIQIQCAQCHHHPTDRWKREQFHELAAFFPRIAVRPVKIDGKNRSFEIVSMDRERGNNKDKNKKRGSLEHQMPDLKHPEKEGKTMKPVFFVTGQKLELGKKDKDRREQIADWITDRQDRWFAKAFVNRMWSELVGHGFYEPVDDIGPDRACSAPQALNYLSEQFASEKYDVKWLMTAITSTDAYQRESRSRVNDKSMFASTCPQRLRGDQLYDSLIEVLGIPDTDKNLPADNPRAAQGGSRGRLNQTFGYDPSVRRDEIAGSVPQALFLMNSPELGRGLNGHRKDTSLGKLLDELPKDEDLVEELYLRCLAREPKPSELATCLDYLKTAGNRVEAFEDVLWSLVNSTEFLNRK